MCVTVQMRVMALGDCVMLPIHQKRFGKDSWKTISSHLLTSKDKCLEILVTAESQTEVLQRL